MRSAGTLLFGLAATDMPTLAGATCLLACTGLLAGAIPAWRAAHTKPDVALRGD
jgi:ABC-type lipoprotein release transport system permease subunit